MARINKQSPVPRIRTEEEQKGIASDVIYEWKMFSWTFEALRRSSVEKVLSVKEIPFPAVLCYGTSLYEEDASAMLEPFLLHARNIRDFLYRDFAQREDDVLAADFFDDAALWTARRPPIGKYLESLRERLNKAVAHLSYRRLKNRSDEGWDIKQIKSELRTPWNAFIRTLPQKKKQWFENWQ